MAGRKIDYREPGILEVLAKFRLDFIENRAPRAPGGQTARSNSHRVTKKVASGRLADHIVEFVTVAQRLSGGVFHSFRQRLFATDLDQPSVAIVIVGGPLENFDSSLFSDEPAQALAHVVPVDEKHETGGKMLKVPLKLFVVGGAKGACRQLIRAHFDRGTRANVGAFPLDIEL